MTDREGTLDKGKLPPHGEILYGGFVCERKIYIIALDVAIA